MTAETKTASTTSSEVRMTRRIVVEVHATAHEADLALRTFEQVAEHLNATARYGRDVVSAPKPASTASGASPQGVGSSHPVPLSGGFNTPPGGTSYQDGYRAGYRAGLINGYMEGRDDEAQSEPMPEWATPQRPDPGATS